MTKGQCQMASALSGDRAFILSWLGDHSWRGARSTCAIKVQNICQHAFAGAAVHGATSTRRLPPGSRLDFRLTYARDSTSSTPVAVSRTMPAR